MGEMRLNSIETFADLNSSLEQKRTVEMYAPDPLTGCYVGKVVSCSQADGKDTVVVEHSDGTRDTYDFVSASVDDSEYTFYETVPV